MFPLLLSGVFLEDALPKTPAGDNGSLVFMVLLDFSLFYSIFNLVSYIIKKKFQLEGKRHGQIPHNSER